MSKADGKAEDERGLTKDAFEKLLTKAAQPIPQKPDPKAARTSKPQRPGD